MINAEGKMYNEDQIGRGEIILSFTKEGNLFHITSANSPLIRFVYQDKILFLFSCLLNDICWSAIYGCFSLQWPSYDMECSDNISTEL